MKLAVCERLSICAASFATVRSGLHSRLKMRRQVGIEQVRREAQPQAQDSLCADFVCHRRARSQSSGCIEINAATSAIHINRSKNVLRRERKSGRVVLKREHRTLRPSITT